jgi:hypothetical protein
VIREKNKRILYPYQWSAKKINGSWSRISDPLKNKRTGSLRPGAVPFWTMIRLRIRLKNKRTRIGDRWSAKKINGCWSRINDPRKKLMDPDPELANREKNKRILIPYKWSAKKIIGSWSRISDPRKNKRILIPYQWSVKKVNGSWSRISYPLKK